MDRNLLLAFALSFLVLSLWSMLQEPAPPQKPVPQGEEVWLGDESPPLPTDAGERYPELPAASPGRPPLVAPPTTAPQTAVAEGEKISIERPLFEVELDSLGGAIDHWELTDYFDRQGDRIVLVRRESFSGAAVTPFLELGLGDLSGVPWSVEQPDSETVVFSLERNGVAIRKTFIFPGDGYDFRMRVEVDNGSDAPVAPRFLVDWPVEEREGNDFREISLAALHNGDLETTLLAGLGSGGFFGFFTGAKAGEPQIFDGEVDWAGLQTPYFLGALFPDQPSHASARFVPLQQGKGAAEIYFAPVELPPGQSATREFRGYVGPKQVERLEAFAPSALRSIDFGWSWVAPLTRGFGWLLHVLYGFIPNYGWAIIVLTILVRIVTAPLTMKQMKSMERMRRIQPKMKELQEKFADDRQKQSEAMMKLYKEENVNPLGGCFPMVLQLPVFIGLFYALRSSIHLRHAPFIGWIDDLSAPDLLFTMPGIDFPIRVLPIIMGVSMVAQQKITPMQADPSQARIMMTVMPVMMMFISYTFPSGLVLYWMVSNVLAISHQLWIGRKVGPAADSAK